MGKKTRYGSHHLAKKFYSEMIASLPKNFKPDFGHFLYLKHGTSPIDIGPINFPEKKAVVVTAKYKTLHEIQIQVDHIVPLGANKNNSEEIISAYYSAIGTFQFSDCLYSRLKKLLEIDGLFSKLLVKVKPFERFTASDGLQKIIPIEVVGFTESPLNQK